MDKPLISRTKVNVSEATYSEGMCGWRRLLKNLKKKLFFLSFTPLCYKMGLVKTLIDRTFKINNTWLGFHNDIQNLFTILRKNLYPDHVLDVLLHRYVTRAVVGNDTRPSTGVEKQELVTLAKTSRHFSTRVHEHLSSDRSSHVYKHLQASESCRTSCNLDCFTILDSAPIKYQVKLKESMYIKWEKPDLNQQVNHINLTLSL